MAIYMNSRGRSGSADLKCSLIEERLQEIWPEWHVLEWLGGGSFGDVFHIWREHFGVRVDSALKVIRVFVPDEAEVFEDAFSNEVRIMELLRGAPNVVAIEDFYFKKADSWIEKEAVQGKDTPEKDALCKDASEKDTLEINASEIDASIEGASNKDGEKVPPSKIDQNHTLSERAMEYGYLYVRMELLTGFRDYQKKKGDLSTREILKVGMDVCSALMYCEDRNIIHRDIKPTNLFIDQFGNFKVGDFGVSRITETVHLANRMTGTGTVTYMAPEIFAGEAYNNTVDIYALGLILYQLLNKDCLPFLPSTPSRYSLQDVDKANYRRFFGEEVPPVPGIDPALNGIVLKALVFHPDGRYRYAREFYQKLREYAEKLGRKDRQDVPAKDESDQSTFHETKELRKDRRGEKSVRSVSQTAKKALYNAPEEKHVQNASKTAKKKSANTCKPEALIVDTEKTDAVKRNTEVIHTVHIEDRPGTNPESIRQKQSANGKKGAYICAVAAATIVVIAGIAMAGKNKGTDHKLEKQSQETKVSHQSLAEEDEKELEEKTVLATLDNTDNGISESSQETDSSKNDMTETSSEEANSEQPNSEQSNSEQKDSGERDVETGAPDSDVVETVDTMDDLPSETERGKKGTDASEDHAEDRITEKKQISTSETMSPAHIIHIKDANLKRAIQNELRIGDREITVSDASRVTELTYDGSRHNGRKISDLSGISFFTELNRLELPHNLITDLSPLENLESLEYLDVADNRISDISSLMGHAGLKTIIIEDNSISESDLNLLGEMVNIE